MRTPDPGRVASKNDKRAQLAEERGYLVLEGDAGEDWGWAHSNRPNLKHLRRMDCQRKITAKCVEKKAGYLHWVLDVVFG